MLRKSMHIMYTLILGSCFIFGSGFSNEINFKWKDGDSNFSISTQLKERVVISLLQESIRQKAEKMLVELNVFLEKDLPYAELSLVCEGREVEVIEELKLFLESNSSYFSKEFEVMRETWQQWVQREKVRDLNQGRGEWLSKLESILQEISITDLVERFSKDTKELFKNRELETFLALPLTEEDKEIIRQFIADLTNKNIIQIIADREDLLNAKERLKVVHPLRLIAFIWSDPELSKSVRILQKSDLKWTFLVLGQGRSIKRKKESRTLNEYVPGFADFLKVDRNVVQSCIDRDDYNGLFDYLMEM